MNSLEAHNYGDLDSFMYAQPTDLEQLTEADEDGDPTLTRLRLGHRSKISLLHRFVLANRKMELHEWMTVDADALIDFRLNPTTPPGTTTTNNPGATNNTLSKSQAISKGVKRETSAFPVIKDDKMYASWHVSFQAVAHAQQVHNVLNPTYVRPGDNDNITLWAYQPEYMYSVLATMLQTNQGRTFVREHATDCDAQSVWRKYIKFQTKSTAADNKMNRISEFLTTQKWSTSWPGTAAQFVLCWKEQLRRYQDLADTNARMPENMQKLHLRNAVSANPEMASIGSFEATAQLINATANALTFDAYYETVLDAARRYDAAHAPRSGSGRTKKFVNFHDIDSSPEIEIDFLDGGDEDLYPEPNNLLAYSHQQFSNLAQDPNANARFDAYQALQKQQWDQFRAQQQQHNPNFIPGNVWRQLPSWAQMALQEKDRDQRALIAAQTPKSDQRKVAFTNQQKVAFADQGKLDTNSSESLEHKLRKWVLEHNCKECAIDNQARSDEQDHAQCSDGIFQCFCGQ